MAKGSDVPLRDMTSDSLRRAMVKHDQGPPLPNDVAPAPGRETWDEAHRPAGPTPTSEMGAGELKDTYGVEDSVADQVAGPHPGKYGAEGDPYTYELFPDGSVAVDDGKPMTAGSSYDAIKAQIKSGQLQPQV